MAARRGGCSVNSLWSGSERVRIGERLRATLAGVLELEVLRCKHLEMVGSALALEEEEEEEGSRTPESAATSRCRQQTPSPSDTVMISCQSCPEDCGTNPGDVLVHSSSGRGSRWSTLSWDAPSDLLSPPTPDPSGVAHLDSDSRPSSGFYSVSGSSLSDSSYSVSSDATHGGAVPPARPLKLWEQVQMSADNTDTQWSEGAVQPQQPVPDHSQEDAGPTDHTPVSVSGEFEATGLSFLSDLCSGLGDSLISSIVTLLSSPTSPSSFNSKCQLDPRFCTDLVSRRTKEVYSYPSPLHAVALQSPLFTSQSQEQSTSTSTDGHHNDELQESNTGGAVPSQPKQPPTLASLTHLEQFISRLARQHHSRIPSSTSDLPLVSTPGPVSHRGTSTTGKSHGSTQSLLGFESRREPCTLPGGSITPCKSLLGNSARVSLSTAGKKGTRNSINLGNLPSATGEDLNINLHLNLNLNLTPGLSSSQGLVDNPKNGSCGAQRGDFAATPTGSASSLSSATPTPGLRSRSRISTCPGNLSHRSSLEVPSGSGAGSGFGSSVFCRSLDWSSGAPSDSGALQSAFGKNTGSAPGSQRSSLIQESNSSTKLSEDSPMVMEISRLSGLSRSVVVGLMEQGVELDIDCFQTDSAAEVRGHGKTHLTAQKDQSHDYSRMPEVNHQRPIQLSLSVTHSPQSQCSFDAPLSQSSSPIHPHQSIHISSPHYSSHCHYQHIPSPSEHPSSTASSPASHPTPRAHSPPRPLQPSPLGATPLSVFRRDSPFQCSLPHNNTRASPLEYKGIQPRGGSLRQSAGGSEGSSSRWQRVEGEGLYRGKHASHKLVRAATVSSYAKRDDYISTVWTDEEEMARSATNTPKRSSSKLWRGFWGKESESEKDELDRAEYGYGWRSSSVGSWRREQRRGKASCSRGNKKPQLENSPIFSTKRGKDDGEKGSSSLRLSRRVLFRSESQGLLVPSNRNKEPTKRGHWVSSLDVGPGGMAISKEEGFRLLRAKEEDKRLSSTASLFNLSRSQSLEGSCQSLSPLSSPSFSPSPPLRMPLQRSRSLRDLGRKVFGSMRSLSLKRKPSKK
ncbi:uncharacterized protein si:ch211-168f7.5 [Cololabis saira]|uniref:uncharacterized protein si:ch211-168f7.5 n=1 Tax=Cololabis saira TaxID=129043 RepID=UPI002AD3F34C|nr:uncharacterized protein si:ch211-168f7.5 [Cololabis saira]